MSRSRAIGRKGNIKKQDLTPEPRLFRLTREEIMRISQFVISSSNSERGTLKFSKSVMAFTEQGVAMLSSVLNSERAVQVNIAIMRAFVKLRELLSTHKELAQKLNQLERKIEKHDEEIKVIFDAIRQLTCQPERNKRKIGFRREKEK